jgi:AsmA protein
MRLARSLRWTLGVLLAPLLLALLFVYLFGWNWLRAPIERIALQKTGRVLSVDGDIKVGFGWFVPTMQFDAVRFANPPWAGEKLMLTADAVHLTFDLPQLLRLNVVLPEVRLQRPVVFLEKSADGRKSWLLDREQQDESARVQILRLTLDHGTLGYDDLAAKTHIRSELNSVVAQAPGSAGVAFSAVGQYRGLALNAQGVGGPVLALRDETTPYPLDVQASVGQTRLNAVGSVTSLTRFTAMDMRLAASGESLDQLYPLLGFALPATRAYVTAGQLVHNGKDWRYDKFTGRIGDSDIAGSMRLDGSGARPALAGELVSQLLDLKDLGPLIGARPGSVVQAVHAPPGAAQRVLPDLPF